MKKSNLEVCLDEAARFHYLTAIRHVSNQIFARFNADTRHWLAEEPGRVTYFIGR
jgi:hypothetical protein